MPDLLQPLSPQNAASLTKIEPSYLGGAALYPCEAVLHDGSTWPRVYVVDAEQFAYIGDWPWKSNGMRWLPVENIASLRECPGRLPASFATQVRRAGESGMGYFAFSLGLRDGRKIPYVTGWTVDFLQWPEGVLPSDVVSVHLHDRGDAASAFKNLDCVWSPYLGADPRNDGIVSIEVPA